MVPKTNNKMYDLMLIIIMIVLNICMQYVIAKNVSLIYWDNI